MAEHRYSGVENVWMTHTFTLFLIYSLSWEHQCSLCKIYNLGPWGCVRKPWCLGRCALLWQLRFGWGVYSTVQFITCLMCANPSCRKSFCDRQLNCYDGSESECLWCSFVPSSPAFALRRHDNSTGNMGQTLPWIMGCHTQDPAVYCGRKQNQVH